MKIKSSLILLFTFLMILSLFTSYNLFQQDKPSSINNTCSVQQSGCPLLVSNGQVIIPIDIVNITAVYKYQDYDFSVDYNAQTATDYYTGNYDSNKGLIYNLNLPDNTQIVVVGFNIKNNQIEVLQDFCFNACGSFINVFSGQINGSFDFAKIIGVYKQSDFDYGASPITNQPGTNYFTTSSSYTNGIITGINLPDGTWLVVLGEDSQGRVYFMDNWCHPMTFGVHNGDEFIYTMTHNMSQAIPFFDFNTTYVSSGDNITIKINNLPPNFSVDLTVGTNPTIHADHAMFFLQPLEYINASINNDPNISYEFGNVTYFDDKVVTYSMNDSKGVGDFTYDRAHGYLMSLQGILMDPNGNGIEIDIELKSYIPAPLNPNPNPMTNPYGVKVGDSFNFLFSANITGPFPLFDLNYGNFIVSSRDYIQMRVDDIYDSQNGPEAIISLSVANNQPFKTNDTMFFLMPLSAFDMFIKGVNLPSDAPTLVSYDDNVVILKMVDPQGNGQAVATMDRKLGVLINFNGTFLDPQKNAIQMSMDLKSTILNGTTENYTAPTLVSNSTSSDASSSNILTTTPSFELIVFLPAITALIILKKRK